MGNAETREVGEDGQEGTHLGVDDVKKRQRGGGVVVDEEHAAYCFEVLMEHLMVPSERRHEVVVGNVKDVRARRERREEVLMRTGGVDCAMFVTWNIWNPEAREYRLRGCIGTFEPQPVVKGLKEYAVISGVRDSRFPPISMYEIPKLQCSTSLLHTFEEADAWDDWEVGTHGISIEFVDPVTRRRHSATFLPEVATQQSWNRRETLEHLIAKSGYRAGSIDGILKRVRLRRYQSSKYSLSFSEYEELIGQGRLSSKVQQQGELVAEDTPVGVPSSPSLEEGITVPAA